MDREITITISDEVARKLDEDVAAGQFPTIEEAASVAVANAYADWLTDDVVRRLIKEADADPGPVLPLDEAFKQIHAHIDVLTPQQNERP
jgi:hypothetical protein